MMVTSSLCENIGSDYPLVPAEISSIEMDKERNRKTKREFQIKYELQQLEFCIKKAKDKASVAVLIQQLEEKKCWVRNLHINEWIQNAVSDFSHIYPLISCLRSHNVQSITIDQVTCHTEENFNILSQLLSLPSLQS